MGVIWIPIDTWWVSSECHTNTYWYPVSILGVPYKFLFLFIFIFCCSRASLLSISWAFEMPKSDSPRKRPKKGRWRPRNEVPKRGTKTEPFFSLSPDARLRGGTLLLLLHHLRALLLLLLLLLRLVFTRLLSRSVCLCLSAAADSVLKTLYTGRATRWAFFLVEIRLML